MSEISVKALAYLGDCVIELCVRRFLVSCGISHSSELNSAALDFVRAGAQAEAVKKILVEKYKIAAERISAEGQGVGNMFSEPDWNRVSICTLDECK